MIATHCHLECFVSGARVQPSPFGGQLVTFHRIFRARPDGFRFAVARELLLIETGPEALCHQMAPDWVCWDLYDELLAKVPASGKFMPPAPIWRAPNPDALLMRAVHHG